MPLRYLLLEPVAWLVVILFISSSRAAMVPYNYTCKPFKDNAYSHGLHAYTTFDSSISRDGPLMWTVGSWKRNKARDPGMEEWGRDFYLSTPPSLNLTAQTDFLGLSLILFNATSSFQVPENFTDYDSFSCNSVMSQQCQTDIVGQASEALNSSLKAYNQSLMNSTFSDSTFADNFAKQNVPQSCGLGQQQATWGLSRSVFLTGDRDTENMEPGVFGPPGQYCFTNNDTAHNDLVVESWYAIIPKGSDEIKAFQNGTTPVLTMFFNDNGLPGHLPALSQPEVMLSCLKTVPTEKEQAKINFGSRASGSPFLLLMLAFVVAAAFQL